MEFPDLAYVRREEFCSIALFSTERSRGRS